MRINCHCSGSHSHPTWVSHASLLQLESQKPIQQTANSYAADSCEGAIHFIADRRRPGAALGLLFMRRRELVGSRAWQDLARVGNFTGRCDGGRGERGDLGRVEVNQKKAGGRDKGSGQAEGGGDMYTCVCGQPQLIRQRALAISHEERRAAGWTEHLYRLQS